MVPKNIKFAFSTFYSFFFKQINIQTQTSYTKLQTIPKYSFFQSYLHVHIKMCHISHKIILQLPYRESLASTLTKTLIWCAYHTNGGICELATKISLLKCLGLYRE